MTVLAARWVLFISLGLMLPLPFFVGDWYLSTVLYIVLYLLENFSLLMFLQLLLGLVLISVLAFLYGWYSRAWMMKIRGSILGLPVLTALVILSSISIYDDFARPDSPAVTFMQLY